MFSFIYIIITGLLVRADGSGINKKLFNAWSCAILFAFLTFIGAASVYTAFAAGLAFWIWRAPGFDGWESWLNMFWRGWWTSAIGFSILSCVVRGHPSFGLLAVPFSAIYMLIYSGGYKWLPLSIFGVDRHTLIEHATGWVFGFFVLIIL